MHIVLEPWKILFQAECWTKFALQIFIGHPDWQARVEDRICPLNTSKIDNETVTDNEIFSFCFLAMLISEFYQ